MQTSFIGDIVLTTPLLARLATDGDVDVVTTPVGATLLASHPAVTRVIVYDKRGRDRGATGLLRTARQARSASGTHEHSCAYLAQGSMRSAALALAAGCDERVGFTTSAGRALYTRRVEYRDDWHHARRLLSLGDLQRAAEAHDLTDDAIRPRLYPATTDITAVDELLQHQNRPFVALAPGSVWATKRWPGFAELARLLAPEYDLAIVGGAADRGLANEIADGMTGGHVIDATGKLSLLGSAELIRRSLTLVSNDSSPQHLASAMGTPTVTLFGPTVPAFGFGPLAPGSVTMGRDTLPCRPCDRHGPRRCPLGHWHCMMELTPDEVNTVVRRVIAEETVR